MKRKLTFLYLLFIIFPITVLALFGYRAVSAENKNKYSTAAKIYSVKLSNYEDAVSSSLKKLKDEVNVYHYLSDLDYKKIREISREIPFVRQIFTLKEDGSTDFPPADNRSNREVEFINRTKELWDSGVAFFYPDENGFLQQEGWYRYFEGSVTSFIYWFRNPDGSVLGFDIYREYLIADILIQLELAVDAESFEKFIVYDELGRTIFTRGGYIPGDEEEALISKELNKNLGGWRISAFVDDSEVIASGSLFPQLFSIIALIFAIMGIGFLFWRETNRTLSDARKKVSFVNQVSHELKTPLTNIRMYSEMLEYKLEDSRQEQKYAGIIVQESERLSRMIQNVLSFSRDSVPLHLTKSEADTVLQKMIDVYIPRLSEKSMKIIFTGNAAENVELDVDLFEQICWNLLSNAEKYASEGKLLEISSVIDGHVLKVTFKDYGPGIPSRLRDSVFDPFFRGRQDVTEGVSGTGLGLSISRALAEKHGGSLQLVDTSEGCCFSLTLKIGLSADAGDNNENSNS